MVFKEVVRAISSTKKLFVGGGFNEHIEPSFDEYDDVYRGFD